MTDALPTVIVVDDDPSVREALRSLLRSVGIAVMVCASVQEFLAAVLPVGPSCMVLDIRMPGRSGLDLQEDLVRANVLLPIIFITGHADIPMTVRAMKAGAVEFLAKPFRDQDLLDAIQIALERDQARRHGDGLVSDLRASFATLSPREREVMSQVVSGRLNKQIAARLGVSEITVKVHRGQVMRKMAAASLAQLVRMADSLGLTSTSE